MKKKNGFTLIELLAVIIILGILMIIAIPSVTTYIQNSRKSAYIDTAREIISGTRTFVNQGKVPMYDTNVTYYVNYKCINTENASKSPYGEFVDGETFVVVTYNGSGFNYYWVSRDETGQGIKTLTLLDDLDEEDIETNIASGEIKTNVPVGNRTKTQIINANCQKEEEKDADTTSAVAESGNSGNTTPSNIVCKPATTLHTATCNRTDSYGCNATRQAGNGNTITYGTLVSGSPKAGDAYDCDVNNDGTYDSATERFYYVGSSGSNSILIYYKNMNNQIMYAYDSSNQNYHGPRTGYQYLPSTSEWDNPGLIAPGTRAIKEEHGNGSTSGGAIESFTYEGKAARFLTYQEVASACGSSGMFTAGYLNNCTWLMENLGQYEGSSGAYGYWLETPRSASANYVWRVTGSYRDVVSSVASKTSDYGVRPAITVLTSNISN